MSDSEEDAGDNQTKTVSKYECPADFVSMQYSSSNALKGVDGEKEVWLIEAPARFDPQCFENLKFPLSGQEMVQSSNATSQTYSVLSSRTTPSDLHLLIPTQKRKPVLCSSGFSGVLKISESYRNCSENQCPVPIPAAPAPSIPAGLRQRFQPFGCFNAAHVQDEVTVVSPTAPKRTNQEPIEDEEGKKSKKKKKKKDKRQEESEEVFVKEEQTQIDCDQLEISELKEEEPMEEMKKKKKKVKKEKERHSEDMVFDESFISKTEPLDPSYEDCIDTPRKTKKKKMKSSHHQ